ncbi:hypothetical protein RJT34_06268 [Clitoria ternatea]|uniref:Uncharacterized protein n=1 Tax=Clitoria ternatea TaxID=43366 RepID=A0AAN9K403_CLITE
MCPRCSALPETFTYCVRDCPLSKMVWTHLGIQVDLDFKALDAWSHGYRRVLCHCDSEVVDLAHTSGKANANADLLAKLGASP